ncbi:MAG: chemotaxis-specific protein-glutamate methyltransferase CheB [Erythrobacter sp.]|nr:chemotaxis-specific protein-glutamate methyltransferase CheB [Erythrobacter sp.]
MAAALPLTHSTPAHSTLAQSDRSRPARTPKRVTEDTVRVMLVDDSLTVRTVFSRMIDREDDLAVVAEAGTAEKALFALRGTPVDVILLDLEMPGMGGLEALPKLLEAAQGAHVLVVSSLTEDGAEHTLSALSIGAADTMLKPRPGGFNDEYRDALLTKIRALGGRDVDHGTDVAHPHPAATPAPAPAAKREPLAPQIVAIGASTGGIHALNLFLRRLPHDFDLPIFITQHLPESFIPVFARQMELAAGREAVLAEEGTSVRRNRILIAPGTGHLTVKRIGPASSAGSGVVTTLAQHRAPNGCLPSVDPMFESLAEVYNGHVAAVLLSGMGRDGTSGAEAIARAGGALYAQDEASCAVWGMPRAVSEAGLAHAVAAPEELADAIVKSARSPAEHG